MTNDLPCRKIRDCWFELIPIQQLIDRWFSEDQKKQLEICSPPKTVQLYELIQKAQKTQSD